MRLQLDSGSDLSILNHHTWCKIGKLRITRTKKVACSVTGERIRFESEVTTSVTLKIKTLKLKMFVLRNTNNLFGTDWIQKFELWDSPISDFCQKVDNITAEAEKLKKYLKESFPNGFFSEQTRLLYKNGGEVQTTKQCHPSLQKETELTVSPYAKDRQRTGQTR